MIAIADRLSEAEQLLKGQRAPEALALCAKLLEEDATRPDTWRLSTLALLTLGRTEEGIAQARLGLERCAADASLWAVLGQALHLTADVTGAIEAYERALALNPLDVATRMALADLLATREQYDAAITHYRMVVAQEPRSAQAHYALALLLLRQNDPVVELHLRRAVQHRSGFAEAHNTLGVWLLRQERTDEGIVELRRAISAQPAVVDARHNLGVALWSMGQLDDALSELSLASGLAPRNAAVQHALGRTQLARGDVAAARACFERAWELSPKHPQYGARLAATLVLQREFVLAQGILLSALQSHPDSVEVRHELGALCMAWHRDRVAELQDATDVTYGVELLIQAVQHFTYVVGRKPNDPRAHSDLGKAYWELRRFDLALDSFARALRLSPQDAALHRHLGIANYRQGNIEAARAQLEQACALDPSDHDSASHLLLVRHYRHTDRQELTLAHRAWGERFANIRFCHVPSAPTPRQLRLGFLSGDLRRHPIGYFLAGVLPHIARQEFDVVCYTGGRAPDDLTEKLRAHADVWSSIYGLSDDALAERIAKDQIDILFDCAGHTAGNHLTVFAQKPAPLQITGFGHVDSTGLAAIDYLIADPVHVRDGEEGWYTENILRMERDYVCYAPPDYAPRVSNLPLLAEGRVTFGCFNNIGKLGPEALLLFATVLCAVPSSRLVLKSHGAEQKQFRERVQDELVTQGVSAERVVFEGGCRHAELMAHYARVDIALDPAPYSGGLTTLEALWMGVPVVTLSGDQFCGRHSASHLTQVGLQSLVTSSLEGYVAAAQEILRDPSALARLRRELRPTMARSALLDHEGYTRELSRRLLEIWRAGAARR